MAEAYYAGKGYTDVNVVRNGTKGVTVSYTDA
jgi:hypothetical protein